MKAAVIRCCVDAVGAVAACVCVIAGAIVLYLFLRWLHSRMDAMKEPSSYGGTSDEND